VTSSGRTARRIFLAVTLIHLGASRGHFISTDEISVYQATRSLVESGDLSVDARLPMSYPGRDGRYYAIYSPAPSIVAVPLYWVGRVLRGTSWAETFAGSVLEWSPGYRWGGDSEIFFVNLLNVFLTALWCAVFYLFSLHLGAPPRRAFLATMLVATTSYTASFSSGFFQHPGEAAFLLLSCYLLSLDRERPDWRLRLGAGAAAALMFLFRAPSLVALPALTWFLFSGARLRRRLDELLPFLGALAAGLLLQVAINDWKWGTPSLLGPYASHQFSNPLVAGLYAFLLSPGASLFVFTPLLLLTPWLFRHLRRAETQLLLALAGSYLIFYSKYEMWHGMWCYGPRYLAPIVPLLLLPLGSWLSSTRRLLVVAPLALAGLWVQLTHLAVNFWHVATRERYFDFRPRFGFLFDPQLSPLAAHSRALAGGRVDFWLFNVYRSQGIVRFLDLAVPLAMAATIAAFAAWRSMLDEEQGTVGH
jgi:hypothetical protein